MEKKNYSKQTSIVKNNTGLVVTVSICEASSDSEMQHVCSTHQYEFPSSLFPAELAMQIGTAICSANSYLVMKEDEKEE